MGTPVIELDEMTVHLETRKTTALLAYVVLSSQAIPREVLADLFWPDFDQKHAYANLRRSLSSANHSLGGEVLIPQESAIGINPKDSIWVDAAEFHRLVSGVSNHTHAQQSICADCLRALESAVGLCRGEFLAGLNLPDCPEFDEWQYFQREGFKQELARTLEQLACEYAAQGKWEPAIGHARRRVGLDRLDEAAQRTLMDLYIRSGQRSAALRQYESLNALLQEEIGQPPEDETVQLYKRIQAGEYLGTPDKKTRPTGASPDPVEPLVKTKLVIPPLRAERVPRPRLADLLNAGSRRALTLVSAPAGFGKTTLLENWAAQALQPIAWFSIDEGDNDPVRFLTYLIAALEGVVPALSQEFQGIFQTFLPDIQPVLIRLVNHLAEVDGPFTLVLDDYHFIHSQEVHRSLAYLIENLPGSMHVVLSTRMDPPLPLARLRARDQLVEIRAEHLRFTTEESREFLQQVMALDLTGEDVCSLGSRTEGWIAGLQMAGLAIRTMTQSVQRTETSSPGWDREEVSGFVRAFSGSHRYIMDYLGEEVLNRQPEEIREFLMRTSILDRMCAPLCDAILEGQEPSSGDQGSIPHAGHDSRLSTLDSRPTQGILEYIERSNLFLVPLDNERGWYRYHHLFQELLRYRMQEAGIQVSETGGKPGIGLEPLHLRAADWFEEHGYVDEAIHHLLAARQFERAAGLIEGQANRLIFVQNQIFTLSEWLAALPLDQFRLRPHLSVIQAWTLFMQNRYAAGQAALGDAERTLVHYRGPDATGIAGEIALARGVFAELSERNAVVMREQALQAWEKLPEGQLMLRGLAAWLLGVSYYHDGDPLHAEGYLSRAVRLCKEAGNVYFTLVSIGDLSGVLRELGRVREAYTILVRTEQEMSAAGRQPHPSLGYLYIFSGQILYQMNRLKEAERHLDLGIRLVKQGIPEEMLIFATASLPYLRLAQGKTEEAIDLAEECLDRVQSYPLPYLPPIIRASLVRFWIRTGRADRVDEWIQDCTLSLEDPITYSSEGDFTSLAKTLIWQGRTEDAANLLDRLAEYSRNRARSGKLCYVLALQALVLQRQGKTEAALAALEESLRLGQLSGYIRPYLEEDQTMEDLLRLGIRQRRWARVRLDGFVDRVIAAFHQERLARAGHSLSYDRGERSAIEATHNRPAENFEGLSEREAEVLRLAADGLSNPQIGEALHLTTGTVKSHLHHIYGKLGVPGRVQAIAHAKELKLL